MSILKARNPSEDQSSREVRKISYVPGKSLGPVWKYNISYLQKYVSQD